MCGRCLMINPSHKGRRTSLECHCYMVGDALGLWGRDFGLSMRRNEAVSHFGL